MTGHPRTASQPWGRWMVAPLALLLLLALLPLTAAQAAEPASTLCGTVAAAPFADRNEINIAHRENADCAYELGLFNGREVGDLLVFDPSGQITRGQFAATLHRMLAWVMDNYDAARDGFPAARTPRFADVPAGSTFDTEIHQLAATGIIEGYDASTFGPGDSLTRAQTAALFLRAATWVTGDSYTASRTDHFVDVSGIYQTAINAAYEAGFVSGVTAPPQGTYEPSRPTSREQMASLLLNAGVVIDAAVPANVVAVGMSPSSSSAEPGATHTVTATSMKTGDRAFPGAKIRFEVTGTVSESATATASSTGKASFSYTSTTLGTDSIKACTNEDGTLPGSCTSADVVGTASHTWRESTGTTGPAATSAPQLLSVAKESHIGTNLVMQYRFSTVVDGKNPAGTASSFKLYPYDDTATPYTGTGATIATGSSIVRVEFTVAADDYPDITTAGVAYDAVQTRALLPNAEGDAPLNSVTIPGTRAPDLTKVQNFRAVSGVSPTETRVDFVFDDEAWQVSATGAGYTLVRADGVSDIDCTYESGAGTKTHTVLCPISQNGNVQITTTHVARGYVTADTVSDEATDAGTGTATGNGNPLQAADIKASETPDLVSVSFDTAANRVRYTFDEEVRLGDLSDSATGGISTSFAIYTIDGSGSEVTANAVGVLSTDSRVVVAEFTSVTTDYIGANVAAGAVRERFATQNPGEPDEVRTVSTTTISAAGRTLAPDLIQVSDLEVHTSDIQGTPLTYRATFTFDSTVNSASCTTPGSFRLYMGNGERIDGAAVIDCATADAKKVTVRFDVAAGPPAEDPAKATLGTVTAGAVTGAGGPTPEGANKID